MFGTYNENTAKVDITFLSKQIKYRRFFLFFMRYQIILFVTTLFLRIYFLLLGNPCFIITDLYLNMVNSFWSLGRRCVCELSEILANGALNRYIHTKWVHILEFVDLQLTIIIHL